MNLDFLKNLTMIQKAASLGVIVVVIVVLFVWMFYIPKGKIIKGIEGDIGKAEGEIKILQAKADKLDQLKRENAELERRLAEKKMQMPVKEEVASLLKQVSDLGLRAGLDFKLWRPSAKKDGPNNLYTEIPVDVEIAGGYHTTALFFDSVGRLPRLVNISNIQMKGAKEERGRLVIQVSFVATAFAQAELKPPDAKDKAKPGAPAAAPAPAPAKGGGGHGGIE